MTNQAKIFWTAIEKRALGTAIDELVNVTKGYTYMSALTRIQASLLPEHRQRRLKYWATVRDSLMPFILQAKGAREALDAAPVSAEPAPALAPPAEKTLAELLAQAAVPFLINVLSNPSVMLALRALKGAVSSLPEGSVSDELFGLPSYARPVASKRKILIAGLLPAQAEEVRKGFEQYFDLKFWCSDESKEHLKSMAKRTEVAVGIVSFIGHPADALLKDVAPTYLRHPGGIKTLKATLDSLRL